MASSPPSEVTRLLQEFQRGNPDAAERLMPLVYDELRRLASSFMRRERSDHTLQPTALVHEAYMRLVDQRSVEWRDRSHFLAIAAQAMRRILVDHARRRGAEKRGGGNRVTLQESMAVSEGQEVDVLALEEALHELETLDERQVRVVELRFFGGLTVEETAEALGVSAPTVVRDWRHAKAWLRRRLDASGGDGPAR